MKVNLSSMDPYSKESIFSKWKFWSFIPHLGLVMEPESQTDLNL